jgi:hypothetical protein
MTPGWERVEGESKSLMAFNQYWIKDSINTYPIYGTYSSEVALRLFFLSFFITCIFYKKKLLCSWCSEGSGECSACEEVC